MVSEKRSSRSLARYIIFLLSQKGLQDYLPNNTKVQKLLYSYVGFCLLNDIDEGRIIDELPCAWEYGPVFPNVFQMITDFEMFKKIDNNGKEELSSSNICNLGRKLELTLEEENVINKVVDVLGKFPAGKLSTWTHLKGSPWDIVWHTQENEYGKIPLELIKEYFKRRVKNIL